MKQADVGPVRAWLMKWTIAVFGLVMVSASLLQLERRATGAEPIELFNGRDLSGWVNVNGSPGTWLVRDGVLVCTGEPRCFLRTDRMYQNYVLQVQWRHAAAGGNSGIFLHADALPQIGAPYPQAIEVQLLDGDHGSLFGIRGASLLPATNPWQKGTTIAAGPLEERCRPAGQWNQYVITSRDGTLALAVNGREVTRAWRCSQQKGYIALQAEHTEVHFRSIRLTPLPCSEPPPARVAQKDEGFKSLLDGLSFAGWRHLPGHQGHWVVHDGQINYDGKAAGRRAEKDLWTEQSYGDFELIADWRLPSKPTIKPHPIVLPNGDFDLLPDGKRKTFPHLDAGDSGIYLRGTPKAQLNIWSQELGSGEINGYRTDRSMPAEVRLACIPIRKADQPLGQWNRFHVVMRGERVSVRLNGQEVIKSARLPDVPAAGPIGLQHHGDPVQFRNIFVKTLD